jgi:hypothetical protein
LVSAGMAMVRMTGSPLGAARESDMTSHLCSFSLTGRSPLTHKTKVDSCMKTLNLITYAMR